MGLFPLSPDMKSCTQQQPILPPGWRRQLCASRCRCETFCWESTGYGQRQSWAIKKLHKQKNPIKMTWCWFPTTNCTIHFWKRRVFTSWDKPKAARLLPLWLPPTLAACIKLPRKGKLFHPQEETNRVCRAYILQPALLLLFALLLVVNLKEQRKSARLHLCTQKPKRGAVCGHLSTQPRQEMQVQLREVVAVTLEAGSSLN